MPIRMKRIVHTTPNTHEGGESGGLVSSWYINRLFLVRNQETNATVKLISTLITIFFILLSLITFFNKRTPA
jgi:hypothetical protein